MLAERRRTPDSSRAALFETTAKRLGFDQDERPDPPSRFRRPNKSNQLTLF